jgi:hypothetical protein
VEQRNAPSDAGFGDQPWLATRHRMRMLVREFDLPFDRKLGIIAALAGLGLIGATLAQSAEQTLRKRQVKGSSPLGGLVQGDGPQRVVVGAFCVACLWPAVGWLN